MIRLENTDIYGWEAAIRGARNPMNSWDKSDTVYGLGEDYLHDMVIGENDLKLLKSLAKAGPDHGKFMRMITVTVDITAPLYWWKEFDTYKVGTTANSCSTMHKIHAKEFTLDDFSLESFEDGENGGKYSMLDAVNRMIGALNCYRDEYNLDKNKASWYQMIQLLPSSYNQRRTVLLNYAVLKSMYHARKNHKLDEWRDFCHWITTLPHSELIIND